MSGERILIVEDEHMVAESLRRALSACGAVVVAMAPSVEQALAIIADTPEIDGALLDINLRGVRAFAVAEALMARGIPFVFATGYSTPVIPEEFRQVPVLKKPFDPEEILTILFPS